MRRLKRKELSMKQVIGRVALVQFNVSPNKVENQNTAIKYISEAASNGAQLVVLPEIWNGPYATSAFPEYAETLPDVDYKFEVGSEMKDCPSARVLFEQAKEHNIYLVGGSISERVCDMSSKEIFYNTCLCIDPDGKLVGKHRKIHLFDVNVPGKISFKESETLSPGNTVTSFDTKYFGRIGVGICYDIRFPEYSLILSRKYKCNVLIYPGAFNLITGPAHWELLQRSRAVDNQCYILTASPARVENPGNSKYPHYTAWGHSTAVSPWGNILAKCDKGESCVILDLDIEKVNKMRNSIPILTQKRDDIYQVIEI